MNAVLRRRFEMAARVRDLLRAHPGEGAEATALVRLEELLERGDTLAAQQRTGIRTTHAAAVQRAEVRRALQRKLLRYLASVGTVLAKENAERVVELRLPRARLTNAALLTLARTMLEQATEQRELFLRHGMSARLLADLGGAVAEFEQTLEATRAGLREHVGATADLWAVGSAIAEQVRLLDGLVRYRFGDNAELMGAWASARNVVGPVRSKGEAGDVKLVA